MTYNTIGELFTGICDAIRAKDGTTELIAHQDIPSRIENIPVDKVSQSGLNFTSYEKINNGWEFLLIDSSTTSNGYDSAVAQSALESGRFISVNLPHGWSIYNPFNSASKATHEGGYLDGGDAWYRKIITIEDSVDNRYFLYFEGIYMESDVIVNGAHLKTHKHGYTNFIVEITDVVRLNQENTILVYVKNRQPSSRWYSGSGIYRDVFLLKSGKIGFGQQSVKVTTPNLETEYAIGYCNTSAEYTIENTTNTAATVTVEAVVKYFGEEIIRKSFAVSVNPNATSNETFNFNVANPKLWDEYDGQYYTLTLNMYNEEGNIISKSDTYFGYRYFKFDPNTGFWLNGKNIKLRGACVHHDLGILGAEINQSAIDRQILKLKCAGFNAIRLTHNPSCAEYTNACMRFGMMCVEEAFDCWTIHKKQYDYARFFMEYAESDVKSMVKRSVNNPCVIMWSLGNEIYDTRSENASKVSQDPVITATNLRNWIREIDMSRPCTIGEDHMSDSTSQLVSDVLDVKGINYSNNLYSSIHSSHPDWCIYGSETTSALSSRCVYSRDDANHQCSSYDDDKVSWGSYAYRQLNVANVDYVSGMFVWTGLDYIGEPTPFNAFPARSSYFGIMDIAGIPKDIYYLYQSMWTEKPMCHIVPMDWNQWTVGENVRVMVYSNASYVKMYLNGNLVGIYSNKNIADSNSKGSFYGDIPFEKGRLVANAYDANDILVAQDVIYTADAPNKLILKSEKLYYKDTDDLLYVEIDVCDRDGHVCPLATNSVTVEAQGGTVIGIDNGDATSVELYRSATKPVFHGKAIAVIKPNTDSNEVRITATSSGLTNGNISVTKSDMTVYAKEFVEFIDATEPYEKFDVPCESITLSETVVTLTDYSPHGITATVTPDGCTDPVLWTSENGDIASVDNKGNIIAIANGTTNIIATCGSKAATCSVTVELAEAELIAQWSGEESLPSGLITKNDFVALNLDSASGKYYMEATGGDGVSTIRLDKLFGKGVVEFEMTSDDWTAGSGWNLGCDMRTTESTRHVLFSMRNRILYSATDSEGDVNIGKLVNGESYTVKIDNSYSGNPNNVRIYVNDSLIREASDLNTDSEIKTCSDIWMTGTGIKITTIRYKAYIANGTTELHPCESISLNTPNITLLPLQKYRLIPTVTPINCTDIVEYETSNGNVATVDIFGCVTAVSEGTCVITARCGEYTASCDVNIGWDVKWDGESSLPTGLTKSGNAVLLSDDSTGRYYITTDGSSEADIILDQMPGQGCIEFEVQSDNWASGSGWNMGCDLRFASTDRHVVYTRRSSSSYVYTSHNDSEIRLCAITNGSVNTIRIDNSFSSDPKNVKIYFNGDLISETAEYDTESDGKTNSYIWVTVPDIRITAIRYKTSI